MWKVVVLTYCFFKMFQHNQGNFQKTLTFVFSMSFNKNILCFFQPIKAILTNVLVFVYPLFIVSILFSIKFTFNSSHCNLKLACCASRVSVSKYVLMASVSNTITTDTSTTAVYQTTDQYIVCFPSVVSHLRHSYSKHGSLGVQASGHPKTSLVLLEVRFE